MRSLLIVVISLAMLAACSDDQDFDPLPQAAKISIETNYQSDSLRTITDSAQIAAIISFVNARRLGWGTPGFGVPIPRIRANFYRYANDKNPIAHFGAGPGFFESMHRIGDFASRSASREEIREFLRLIGAPSDAADSAKP